MIWTLTLVNRKDSESDKQKVIAEVASIKNGIRQPTNTRDFINAFVQGEETPVSCDTPPLVNKSADLRFLVVPLAVQSRSGCLCRV